MAYDISIPFSFRKNGIFYFERRIPRDLLRHYDARKISYSLRTRNASVAENRARRAADRLDEYWYHLRVRDSELPGKHRLRFGIIPNTRPIAEAAGGTTLSEAVTIYVRLKGRNRPLTFRRAAERSCGYVIDACGDKDLLAYTKGDATRFRDALLERGLSGSSMTRIFGTVRAVVNFAANEVGITMTNPFTGVFYDRNLGVKDRVPLPTNALLRVQQECQRLNDDLRWLVALLSDTGMRLAEAAGLLRDDIVIDAEVPHVVVREHPWRRLKTPASSREVPLVGASLWAAERVMTQSDDSPFAFPRYNRAGETKANAASAALNKWMKPLVPAHCTMHSFRHSMRDRLRAAECPADIVDQMGGWHTEGVGHGYGHGYPLSVLHKWMKMLL